MRPGQLAGRSRRFLSPRLLAAGLPVRTTTRFRSDAAGLGADPAPQSGPTPDPADTGVFDAFGHSRQARSDRLWESGSEGLLFAFHLNGFAQLATYAAGPHSRAKDEFWAEAVESWLRTEFRPKLPAWHPYPTSLRLVSWCSALGALGGWPESLRTRVAGEISRQARYLRRTVEYDIGGNHVLKNATALVFAGVTVPETGVLEPGLRLLQRELARQILPDGAHEELSTSYHREVSHDLGQLRTLLDRVGGLLPSWLEQVDERAEGWLTALAGPKGDVPMLGDAWGGPPIDSTASGRDEEPTVLLPSGHVVLRSERDQVVFDCGPLCPDHLPPHAHADALGFVLWADDEPVIVDRGAFAYAGPDRDRFRATSAHSTVEVDGEDQCVFWGDFRAAYLPRVEPPRLRREGELIIVESSHDGYGRLPDPVVAHRALVWVPGQGVIVVDRLECRRRHDAHTRLQLAPGARLVDGRVGSLSIAPLVGSAEIEEIGHSPFLGRRVSATALVSRLGVSGGEAFGWSILRAGASVRLGSDRALELRLGSDISHVRLRPLG